VKKYQVPKTAILAIKRDEQILQIKIKMSNTEIFGKQLKEKKDR
jgi:hypothetical protein